MQVGNTRLNSFIFTFQICTLIKYNQTNKYVLNADKKMDYPKSESSTCLKILHPRLNNQNTLKIFFLADKSPHQLCISNKKRKQLSIFKIVSTKGGEKTELNVACAGLKNQSDRARTCYLPFNCGHSVYSQVIQVFPKPCTSNKYTVYSQSNENK